MSESRVTDKSIENMVSLVLRTGVIVSGCVVAFGGALYLFQHGGEDADYRVFRSVPAADRLVPEIIQSAFHYHARSIIQFGVLLLIATPILRVALSLVGFALERDRKYVVMTAIVFGVLLYGLISGAMR